jgi:hypothetical protein
MKKLWNTMKMPRKCLFSFWLCLSALFPCTHATAQVPTEAHPFLFRTTWLVETLNALNTPLDSLDAAALAKVRNSNDTANIVGAPQAKSARVRLPNGAVLCLVAENFSQENKFV